MVKEAETGNQKLRLENKIDLEVKLEYSNCSGSRQSQTKTSVREG